MQFDPNYNPAISTSLAPTFIAKVMSLFALAILVTTGGVFLGMQYLMPYFKQIPALVFGIFALELVLIFSSGWWRKQEGLNYALFTFFALLTGLSIVPLMAVVISSPGGLEIVAKALLASGLMFGATAFFGWTTQMNLSWLGGFLFMALIGMVIVGVIGIFVPWSNNFEIGFSAFGVLLFSAYTMYEFQMLKSYPQDEYILAAMSVYLNFFNLFIYILRLMMALRNE